MRDIEYLKSMYPPGIRILQNYVSEACDQLDYKNSPMYDEYPDRMLINRLCSSICDTVVSAEGMESIEKMWNIKEEQVKTEELSAEDKSIRIVPGQEENMPFHIRHKFPDFISCEFPQESDGCKDETLQSQMIMAQRPGTGTSRPGGSRPPGGPGRPPMPPGGPGGPNRPPVPPTGPRPPQRPPRPIPPGRPTAPPSHSRPSWLQDMVKVLLLNEMYNRRCDRGVCIL